MKHYQEKLNNQLIFLKSSCTNYDSGIIEEAVRIALALRIIFYDSNGSTSILSHLEKKRSINLISTFDKTEEFRKIGIKMDSVVASLPLMITSKGVRPPLDSWDRETLKSVKEWMEEIIWKENGINMTRWDIIDSAANQDGGAHVDSKENLTEKTKKLKKGFDGTGTRTSNNITVSLNFENHHYPLLRQFAHEILISNELTNLTSEQ